MVWQHVSEALRNPQVIKDELKRREAAGQGSHSQIQADLEAARRQQKKLEGEIENLVRRGATVDDEVWQVFEKEIAQKKEGCQRFDRTIRELEARLASDSNAVNALEALFEYCYRAKANLANFGFDEKRLALEALGVRLDGQARDWTLKIHIPLAGYSPTTA
jgi:chromosome segregation ATPase